MCIPDLWMCRMSQEMKKANLLAIVTEKYARILFANTKMKNSKTVFTSKWILLCLLSYPSRSKCYLWNSSRKSCKQCLSLGTLGSTVEKQCWSLSFLVSTSALTLPKEQMAVNDQRVMSCPLVGGEANWCGRVL